MSVRNCSRPVLLAVALALVMVLAEAARAEEPLAVAPAGQADGAVPTRSEVQPAAPAVPESGSAAPAEDFTSSRNIQDKVREQRRRTDAIFNFGMRDALLRLDDKIYEATRIRFAAAYTVLYQHAYGGSGPRDAAGGDFDVTGTWDAIRRGGKTTGALEGALEGRHRIETEFPPSGLSTTIDSLGPR